MNADAERGRIRGSIRGKGHDRQWETVNGRALGIRSRYIAAGDHRERRRVYWKTIECRWGPKDVVNVVPAATAITTTTASGEHTRYHPKREYPLYLFSISRAAENVTCPRMHTATSEASVFTHDDDVETDSGCASGGGL